MKSLRALRRHVLPALAMFAFAVGGCAVLTSSQVDAVKQFGTATRSYGTLPGAVIGAYGDVNAATEMTELTGVTYGFDRTVKDRDGNRVPIAKFELGKLNQARATRQAYAERAAVADAALVVLDRYATALVRLSSDEFTDAVDESAVELGQSLDESIGTYNGLAGADLPLVGAAVAQAASGVGRIYIRHRQARLLQAYVQHADPVVAALTLEIQQFVRGQIEPHLSSLRPEIEQQFEFVANGSERIDIGTVRWFSELLDRTDEAQALASSVVASAQQYREAHKALLAATRERQDLTGKIAAIQTLADEIKAARKLKSKFD